MSVWFLDLIGIRQLHSTKRSISTSYTSQRPPGIGMDAWVWNAYMLRYAWTALLSASFSLFLFAQNCCLCSELHIGLLQFEEVKAVMEVKYLFWNTEINSKIWHDFFFFLLPLRMYHTWCVSSEFNASQLLADLRQNIYCFLFQKRKLFGIKSCIKKHIVKIYV